MPAFAETASNLDMRPGVTETSNEVYHLHRMMFWWCVGIGAVVFGAILYSVVAHRKRPDRTAADFHENTFVEIIWTVIPFLILIVMAIPATKTLISMHDTSESELTIKITGYQWKWHYEYLEYQDKSPLKIAFFSNLATPEDQINNPVRTAGLFPSNSNGFEGDRTLKEKNNNYLLEVDAPVIIPTGKKVRFLLTSNDVIHSWWVPDFGFKKDAIPGFINEVWTNVPVGKEGTYRGQCAELCGARHGFMPIEVKAVTEEEFSQWLADSSEAQTKEAEQAAGDADKVFTMEELMALGETEYQAKCAACHQANGQGLPPTFPSLVGSKIATGPVADHINIVNHGKGVMPAFKDQLPAKVRAAIITYERNAWGNNVGDMVQPKDVTALENK
ncbi:MAG: cytochrome c oxidase subunit II [Pseudomonadota bacterium]